MMVEQEPQTLTVLIRRHLFSRVCLCFLIFCILTLAISWQYFSFYFSESEVRAAHIEEELTPYIISQEIIKNRYSIPLKIKDTEATYNVKIHYSPRPVDLVHRKDHGLKHNNLFAWTYEVAIPKIDGINYGSYLISGSILNDRLFLKSIIIQVVILIVFMLLFICAIVPVGNTIPQNLFVVPIKTLLKLLSEDNHNGLLNFNSSKELVMLRNELIKLIEKKEEAMKSKQLVEIGRQVAHDIRSPLSAIIAVISLKNSIDVHQIKIINKAAERLNDIANNLLVEYKIEQPLSFEHAVRNISDNNLVYPMINEIISEKRAECVNKNLDINLYPDSRAIFSSIYADNHQFKRVLSNIINNSIDAVNASGEINIDLKNNAESIEIKVSDNGAGIPEDILPKIMTYRFSYMKNNGNGLGLYHANEYISKIGGNLSIESKVDIGTTVTIIVPVANQLDWLSTGFSLSASPTIVIIDDDCFIHDVWLRKFADIEGIKIHKFSSTEQFQSTYMNLDNIDLLLVDYQFSEHEQNGLDFIIHNDIANRAILVTGQYEEKSIQDICIINTIKILPKEYIKFITTNFFYSACHSRSALKSHLP